MPKKDETYLSAEGSRSELAREEFVIAFLGECYASAVKDDAWADLAIDGWTIHKQKPISPKTAQDFASDFMKLDKRKKMDPIDDLMSFSHYAASMPGGRNILEAYKNIPELAQDGKFLYRLFAVAVSMIHAVNPGLSFNNWGKLYWAVQQARHGGTKIYIRHRKTLAAESDARLLTFKQMQQKHPHLGRSRIYQLLKQTKKK